MTTPAQHAIALIDAYNRQDFDALELMIAPDVDFAHFNRNFALSTRNELLAVLREFAANYMVERHFEPAERITESGDIVILESWYTGTPRVDLPGFGNAGEKFRLKFCSVLRFDAGGMLVEWKDHG
jgi:hypothetical protein